MSCRELFFCFDTHFVAEGITAVTVGRVDGRISAEVLSEMETGNEGIIGSDESS